ncbi:MAG TPA: YqgE/AlgH family protein [Kofleriaceae bacterium]|nr:YqgE/AlgH family protein [Kofleriaceae bacterium]
MSSREVSLAPGLLIAMPQLHDPHFSRAVVLMIEHNDEGSFGLVINHPSELRASELLQNLEMRWAGDEGERVWLGGPVSRETGWVLHEPVGDPAVPLQGSTTISPGLALSTSPDRLRTLAARPPGRFRLLLGYSGWGAGQLASEMAAGSWLHTDVDPELIFDTDPDEIWAAAVRSIGISPETVVQSHGIH